MTTKRKIQNWFNDKAEELGCRARIGGTTKYPKFFEFRGGYTDGDYEVWHGITSDQFVKLINNYPELH